MKNVIERYKKFIFIYAIFHAFALVVNLFNVDISTSSAKYLDGTYYRIFNEINTTYIFTHKVPDKPNKLWPLVDFRYSDFKVGDYMGSMPTTAQRNNSFNEIGRA